MASKNASILLVRKSFLKSCPQAFQDYVARYFESKNVFGIECMYAFRDSDGHSVHCSGGKKIVGIAPSHSLHLRAKVAGELDLYSWMNEVLKDKTQTDFVELSKYWDDGTISSWSDVD